LAKRDFLTGEELGAFELGKLLDRAAALKAGRGERLGADSLAGRSIALVFEKPSTRTRISFEVGVAELGANPIVLRETELQLSRGESIGDTARVLSRFVDAIVIRSGSHETVAELAASAEVPVVNALTPLHHPCQALADLLTLREHRGDLVGQRLAYVGDGNNVARSLAIAGELAGVEVVVAAPPGYQLEDGHEAKLTSDPRGAAAGADALYTDVWVLSAAKDDAIVLHCLPAHPGEEITAELLYGERSAVWDQAENRLHTQKALLEILLSD
jgi:ornithine carbamoyltransferase